MKSSNFADCWSAKMLVFWQFRGSEFCYFGKSQPIYVNCKNSKKSKFRASKFVKMANFALQESQKLISLYLSERKKLALLVTFETSRLLCHQCALKKTRYDESFVLNIPHTVMDNDYLTSLLVILLTNVLNNLCPWLYNGKRMLLLFESDHYRPGQPNWEFWLWIFHSLEI